MEHETEYYEPMPEPSEAYKAKMRKVFPEAYPEDKNENEYKPKSLFETLGDCLNPNL